MKNLQKRILTSLVIFPLSIFFIIKGGNYIVSFLYAVLILGNFEVFSAFKRKTTIIFLDVILVISLLSLLYLRNDTASSYVLLIWIVTLTIFSDIGGYIFGKVFKWKKLTSISPNKTLSGAIGSFFFSFMSVFAIGGIVNLIEGLNFDFFLKPKYFLLAIVFSLAAQIGDISISYFKRLEKIKDTGKILPGHGGIFDRIDGLIFVVIVAYFAYSLNLFP
ncbi:MAG: phosphatidate cytidylyltransferase [Pelagibacteraceae bacterium]